MIIDKHTRAAWTLIAISLFVISDIGFSLLQHSASRGYIYIRGKKKRSKLE